MVTSCQGMSDNRESRERITLSVTVELDLGWSAAATAYHYQLASADRSHFPLFTPASPRESVSHSVRHYLYLFGGMLRLGLTKAC